LHICKELGLTLGQLRREMTLEEVWLWITYFNLMNDEHEASRKKLKSRR
jgi:citrate synthase